MDPTRVHVWTVQTHLLKLDLLLLLSSAVVVSYSRLEVSYWARPCLVWRREKWEWTLPRKSGTTMNCSWRLTNVSHKRRTTEWISDGDPLSTDWSPARTSVMCYNFVKIPLAAVILHENVVFVFFCNVSLVFNCSCGVRNLHSLHCIHCTCTCNSVCWFILTADRSAFYLCNCFSFRRPYTNLSVFESTTFSCSESKQIFHLVWLSMFVYTCMLLTPAIISTT